MEVRRSRHRNLGLNESDHHPQRLSGTRFPLQAPSATDRKQSGKIWSYLGYLGHTLEALAGLMSQVQIISSIKCSIPAFFIIVRLSLFGKDIHSRYLYSSKTAVCRAMLATACTSWPTACSLAMVHVSLVKATDKLIV